METEFSNGNLFLNGNEVITLGGNLSRIENMFVNSSLLVRHGRQDLMILSSLLRRFPKNVVLQPCSTAPSPKAEQEVETTGTGTGRGIPSLPVQPLEQMFQTYIKSVRPFLDSTQLNQTTELIQQFCNDENAGKKLQKLLEERAKTTDNWLSDWWLNTAYLEYRDPVVVYSSPGLVWPREYLKDLHHQLAYAAFVIHYTMDFNRIIEEKEMETEMLGRKEPLCMNQYEKIFGTCRIPDTPRDKLQLQDPNNPSRNILIMYNNYLFSMPAFYVNTRKPLTPEDYYALLLDIVEQGKGDLGPAVGVLTTEHRDNWANSYKKLKMDPNNKRILEDHVEKALFVVCIDNPLCLGSGYDYDTRCSKLLLHGFGYRGNAGNRWYDKTIQIIIGAHNDGKGITYEHSPAEGGPIGVLTDHVYSKVKNQDVLNLRGKRPTTILKAEKLEFTLTESLKEDIEKAGKAIDKLNDELDVFSWSFQFFGKNRLKALKVSPDSFIQVAIQLAFYRMHNHPAAQYESGTLRKYQYGRTDVIRTCSEEVIHFCELMSDPKAREWDKAKALHAALHAHKSYAQNVVNGRGVDRHLLALRILAKTSKLENPKIFNDVAYKKSTYFQLSTSNVPTQCNGVMVYGPLVPDGYACCYNPRDESINFGMSAWSTCRTTRLNEFQNKLSRTLQKMEGLLGKNLTPSKL